MADAAVAGTIGRMRWRCAVVLATLASIVAVVAPTGASAVVPSESGWSGQASTATPTPIQPAPPATSIVPGAVNRSTMQLRAAYDVSASLAWGTRRLSGRVTISATNQSASGIDRLELNTVMAPLGGLRLGTTSVDGRAVRPRVNDQTILVPLGGVLPPGATATLVVRFAATLRNTTRGSDWLFASANGVADLYRWIPWVSRATPFARPNYGDPFVTPSSPQVHVVLTSDVPLRWATTGSLTSLSADRRTATFDAADVRDFVVTAMRDGAVRQATVNGVVVRVVSRTGFASSAVLSAAVNAVAKLEARLGPYPYRLLTVSESAGGYGMEGPMTVWIPPHVAPANLRYLVTHEIAHQWFFGVVGSDQAREPFADEAITDMAARNVLGMRRSSQCPTARLDLSIYRYGYACYYEDIYIQGGNLLDDARRRIGSAAYWAAIRTYIAAHRFGLVHTRTLLDAIDAASTADLAARWRSRFPSLY